MEAIDQSLYLLINADPNTAKWLQNLSVFIAKQVIYIIPITLAATWLWGSHNSRQTALKALAITIIALICNHAIGMLYPTARPFELELGYNFLAHAPTPSFPSNHFTIFMCVGLSFAFGGMALTGISLLILGIIVAWARIYTGVHFPLDMLGAFIISGVLYVLLSPVWQRIAQPVTASTESIYRFIFAVFINAKLIRR